MSVHLSVCLSRAAHAPLTRKRKIIQCSNFEERLRTSRLKSNWKSYFKVERSKVKGTGGGENAKIAKKVSIHVKLWARWPTFHAARFVYHNVAEKMRTFWDNRATVSVRAVTFASRSCSWHTRQVSNVCSPCPCTEGGPHIVSVSAALTCLYYSYAWSVHWQRSNMSALTKMELYFKKDFMQQTGRWVGSLCLQ